MKVFFLCLVLVAAAYGATMQLYEKNGQIYQRVLVPVSSTVIPLDDLPEYQVGVSLGVEKGTAEGKVKKPEGEIKLITANKKDYIKKDKIKKISKEGIEEV